MYEYMLRPISSRMHDSPNTAVRIPERLADSTMIKRPGERGPKTIKVVHARQRISLSNDQ
ncbi:hypothetical protein CVT26_001764 [Gymnopilus dilepis]|uniref:Uncharacterized protein n=1 Tax=Gymnopilus dilepis TaxID=231916 RepID=A0A409WE54_9AGAR|nr:hypothetical protein CVT26_001764 [Gymnopilus dilepis]